MARLGRPRPYAHISTTHPLRERSNFFKYHSRSEVAVSDLCFWLILNVHANNCVSHRDIYKAASTLQVRKCKDFAVNQCILSDFKLKPILPRVLM